MTILRGLPRKILIGAYTFRVHVVSPKHPKLAGRPGMSHLSDQEVYLSRNLQQTAIEIVQHELTHCINWVYGVVDGAREESFTTRHSTGFADLVVRNPRYLTWLRNAAAQMRKLSRA